MTEREPRRRCRKLLNALHIRPPLDVVELCAAVERQRGRRDRLVPYPIPVPGPLGLWIGIAGPDCTTHQDGLVRISPYVAANVDAGPTGAAAPAAPAGRLHEALRAYAAGEPAATHAVPLGVPAEARREAEAREPVVLSEALHANKAA